MSLVGALFHDHLEPAKLSSLATQKENMSFFKFVDSIDGTKKKQDSDIVLQLPPLKQLLSKDRKMKIECTQK